MSSLHDDLGGAFDAGPTLPTSDSYLASPEIPLQNTFASPEIPLQSSTPLRWTCQQDSEAFPISKVSIEASCHSVYCSSCNYSARKYT